MIMQEMKFQFSERVMCARQIYIQPLLQIKKIDILTEKGKKMIIII